MSVLSFLKREPGSVPGKKKPTKKSPVSLAKPKMKLADKPDVVDREVSVLAGKIGLVALVTEKGVDAQSDTNTVVFRVSCDANKNQIAAAVLEQYKIEPVMVRTMNMPAKNRRRGATSGQTNYWKKAYVKLPAGKTIDFTV
ncbi:MAG: 50S ribosomal protein L23 [Candidatus Andersenbacteria bacterium]|nr:50S ribosomal protein L23 [bacterium]MDZ4225753.1 50S ribosomal protein L23 [Candidatus Andersenbacteria bacterium]